MLKDWLRNHYMPSLSWAASLLHLPNLHACPPTRDEFGRSVDLAENFRETASGTFQLIGGVNIYGCESRHQPTRTGPSCGGVGCGVGVLGRIAGCSTASRLSTTILATGARTCPGQRTKKRKTPKRVARRSEDRQLASRAQNAMNATVCRCADTSHKAEYGQLSEWRVIRPRSWTKNPESRTSAPGEKGDLSADTASHSATQSARVLPVFRAGR